MKRCIVCGQPPNGNALLCDICLGEEEGVKIKKKRETKQMMESGIVTKKVKGRIRQTRYNP